jgi:hypothetical protein
MQFNGNNRKDLEVF